MNKQKVRAYKFEKFTYIKPNYNKPRSSSWSKNWLGYIKLSGQYWDGKEVHNFGLIQASLSLIERPEGGYKVAASACRYKPPYHYGYNRQMTGGAGLFIQAVNNLLMSEEVKFLDMMKSQENIKASYKFKEPFVVKI